MESETTGKRIVSKAEYAKAQGQRAGSLLWAFCLLMLCIVCTFAILCLCFWLIKTLSTPIINIGADIGFFSFLTALFGAGLYASSRAFRKTVERAEHMYNVIPLTRANTADLPAPESLVRASTEPMQAQEAVLLRAATESVERHEEQLLRAAAMASHSETGCERKE